MKIDPTDPRLKAIVSEIIAIDDIVFAEAKTSPEIKALWKNLFPHFTRADELVRELQGKSLEPQPVNKN